LAIDFAAMWMPYLRAISRKMNLHEVPENVSNPLPLWIDYILAEIKKEHGTSVEVDLDINKFHAIMYKGDSDGDFVLPCVKDFDLNIITLVFGVAINVSYLNSDDLQKLKRLESFMLHVIEEGAAPKSQTPV
jgi:hypothetical protein